MSDTNIVCIKGRLTKSAELKYTQNQKPFVSFSIAVNESVKDGATGEWSSRANYFDVTAWGKYGEAVAKYMTKGREISDWRTLATGPLDKRRRQHKKPSGNYCRQL